MRGRRCPECAQEWSQRDARFCGSCGAQLDLERRSVRPARPGSLLSVAVRLAGALAAGALVATAATADLAAGDHDRPVQVDDDARTSASPLTDAQVDALRRRSDPNQLRCQPRGCELWRIHRAGAPMATGAVQLGSGAIAVLVGAHRSRGIDLATGEPDDQVHGHRLLALDPESGQEVWSRPTSDFTSVSGAYGWVQLLPGVDGGGFIVAGSTVTAFDARGSQSWVARAGTSVGAIREVHNAVAADGAVVVTGPILDAAHATQYLTAVDPETAELLWTEDVHHVAALDATSLIVVDADGSIRSVDHASGETRWERGAADLLGFVRREGPWLAAQHGDGLRLLDVTTGQEIGIVPAWLTSSLVPAGDGWVGTFREIEPEMGGRWYRDRDEAGWMAAMQLGSDGQVGWTTRIGTTRPWWDCCPIRTDIATGTVSVIDPVRHHQLDLATGELLDVEVTATEGDPDTLSPGLSSELIQRPRPDIEVIRHPDGDRIDIRTPDGEVVVRGGRGVDIASVDPLIVVDGGHLLGVQAVPTS